MFKTLRVSNINSNYYDNTDERYTTSNDLTTPASREEFDAVVGRLRAGEARRAGRLGTTRRRADATARAAIRRVATA